MTTLLKNGKVYVDEGIFSTAILIENGIILALGKEALSHTQVDKTIDLHGKTVLPGFNDAHLHLASVGEYLTACNLSSAESIESLIDLGRTFIAENAPIALYGMGWNQDHFKSDDCRLPTRWDLDQISTEIPIVFARTCGHLAVGNSKSIERLKITSSSTIDGGEILRDSTNRPNGIFTENAVKYLYSVIPSKTSDDWDRYLKAGVQYALENGITSVQSCDVLRDDIDAVFESLHRLRKNGELKVRYHHQFNFQNIHDFERYLETEFKNPNYDTDFLSRGTLKLFKDGSLGARTALLSTPYKDAPETRGVSALSDSSLTQLCKLATEHGVQVITHAIGDAAIQSVIEAYKTTFDQAGNHLRHGLVHCQITTCQQIDEIAHLKIPVIAQPIFIDYDAKIVDRRVGEALANSSYAFKTLAQKGAPVSFSTDAPVEDLNPFKNLYCAITRKPLYGFDKTLNAKEAMSVSEAIDAYTIASAYTEFKESIKGRLKPGYYADLIVLDQDIFEIDVDQIPTITVLKTMVNGQWVF